MPPPSLPLFLKIFSVIGALLAEIVTDNGPAFVQALNVLADRYNIRHIRISPYNSQANSVVERCYLDVQEAIIKSTPRGEFRWHTAAHSVFWAKHMTMLRSTGLSPYFMVHSVEPLFPFDLAEATFLVPPPDTEPLFSSGLIAWRACQLQKHQEDLESIRGCVLKAQFESVKHFEVAFKNRIKNYDFQAGSLVLVRNTRIEKELNQKMKPQYLSPMVVPLNYRQVIPTGRVGRSSIQIVLHCLLAYPLLFSPFICYLYH